MSRALALALATFVALLAACSSSDNASGPPCSPTQGCPSNLECWYAVADGCGGNGHCFAPVGQPNSGCKARTSCACSGALIAVCSREPGDGLSEEPLHGDASDPLCQGDADAG